MMRRSRPYFLMWVGNDDLLVAVEPKGAPVDVSAFVGTWRMVAPSDDRMKEGSMTLVVRSDTSARIEGVRREKKLTIDGRVTTSGSHAYFVAASVDGKRKVCDQLEGPTTLHYSPIRYSSIHKDRYRGGSRE